MKYEVSSTANNNTVDL